MRAEFNAELRQQAACPRLPITDQCSYAQVKEHIAQHVFFRPLQPSREQILQFGIPEQRRPVFVEHTGWIRNRTDAALDGCAGELTCEVRRAIRVNSSRHLEEVSPLCGR